MAWTTPKTWASGYVVLAADLNTHLRDNLNVTAPAVMTTTGDIIYASGANTPARLAKSTTSTQYLANTGSSNAPAWNEVALTTGVSGVLPIANGGLGSLSDPDADRILFWDDSATAYAYLTAGTNLTISGTTMTADAPTQSTQAALEAETDENTYAPPDLIKFSPGVAKAWVYTLTAGGAPQLTANYNVSSLGDDGTGHVQVNWATDFSAGNVYCVSATPNGNASNNRIAVVDGLASASSVDVFISTHDGTETDADFSVIAFGDQ